MKSPFSGLSLVIHLIIIALATLLGVLLRNRQPIAVAHGSSQMQTTTINRVLLRSASTAIVVLLGMFVIITSTLAVKTGVREGAREAHVIYVKREFKELTLLAQQAWGAMVADDYRNMLRNLLDGPFPTSDNAKTTYV